MDVLNRVRDMRTTVENDVSASRAALDAAISGHGRGRGRMAAGGGALALGVLVVGGVVAANATGFLQPESVPAAEAASTVLNRAAELQVNPTDLDLAPGQFLRTTIQDDGTMPLREGWQDAPQAFGGLDGKVIAAVRYRNIDSTYLPAGPTPAAILTETTSFHGIEALGDTSAAQAAWAAYYGSMGLADIGAPAPAPEVWENPSPFDPGDYSTDPQTYLDEYAAKYGSAADPTMSADAQAAQIVHEMWVDLSFSDFYTAPAEYRATHLKALALIPGTEVVDTDGDLRVIEYKSGALDYRATINIATGNVTKVEERYPAGFEVSTWNPDGTRPEFLGDTFDSTTTITQEVVDAAPAVNSKP